MTVTDSAALNNHKIGFMSYWYKLKVLQHSFYIRQPPPQPSWSLYDYDYYYTVHFGFPDNCPLINSDNICFILTVNRVSFEKLPTKTFGSNSWPPANNYTAWLIWILITKALFTRSSILEHVLQLIDIRGKYVAEKKKKDCKKCPLSKSPFPLSFSQSIKDTIQTTWDMGSTISIQQTTNNWHKLCHWQYSNSTFSPPVVHVPSPSPHGCVAPHNVVYILSLYPLPYVSIIGRDWCCQMYDWSPLSPLSSDNSVWPRI